MVAAPKYWAFLSYSHADGDHARRLHLLLERYVLPARARRAHGLPRRLFPIFRDVEELEASSGLTTRLRDALDDSRWLIVLCSPKAAQSRYVNAEIEHFVARHGSSRVLCVLLEGEPPECFPPAIRALPEEPLAADCRPQRDENLARLKLVAAVAGIGFTELRDREAARKRQQRLAATLALAGVAAAALLGWDLFRREHIDHFAGYERRHGVWQGVEPVSTGAARHRAASYRFTRRGRLNPPERVDFVDGTGKCVRDPEQTEVMSTVLADGADFYRLGVAHPALSYCSARFSYSGDGALREETLYNALGVAKFALVYTRPDLAQITSDGYAAASDGGGVRYVAFVRDERGFDRELRFYYDQDQPRSNVHGAYGLRFERDAESRMTARINLDADGRPMGRSLAYARDAAGRVSAIRLGDASAADADAVLEQRFVRDDWGNVIETGHYDAAGQPRASADGWVSRRIHHDDHGRPLEWCYFGADGRPARFVGTHCSSRELDDRGFERRETSVDENRRPVTGSAPPFSEITVDERGNRTGERYLDAQGKPMELYGARQRWSWDERGNLTAWRIFGIDGKPRLTAFAAGTVFSYDARDREVERVALGVDGKPAVSSAMGVAVVRRELDERGKALKVRFFGPDLKPMRLGYRSDSPYGFASAENRYDAFGNRIERRYLDEQGRLVRTSDGIAILRWQYDRLGLPVEERRFDERDQPVMGPDGRYGWRSKYDSQNRQTELTTLGRDFQPAVSAAGYATVRYEKFVTKTMLTDATPTRAVFLDAAGRVIGTDARELTLASWVRERRFADAQDRPAPAPDTGCTVEVRDYAPPFEQDLAGERCLDAKGRLVNRKDTGWAVHRITTNHDHPDQPEKHEYFDAAGRAVGARRSDRL